MSLFIFLPIRTFLQWILLKVVRLAVRQAAIHLNGI
jgi:hypothetical protein